MGTLKVDLIILIVLRQAIKLEILGMKHSSGKSACKRAKDIIGLPKGTSKQKTLEVVEQIINDEKKVLNENSTGEHS